MKNEKGPVSTKGIPHLVTHDTCTTHYSGPFIKTNDNIHLAKLLILSHWTMVTGVWWLKVLTWEELVGLPTEKPPGYFNIVHVKNANGNSFSNQLSNIFVIVKGNRSWICFSCGKSIHLAIAAKRDKRPAAK